MFFHDPSLYGLSLPYKDQFGFLPQKDFYGHLPYRDFSFGYTPWQTTPRFPQFLPQQYMIPQTFANFPFQYQYPTYGMNAPFVPQAPMVPNAFVQPWNIGWQRPVTC